MLWSLTILLLNLHITERLSYLITYYVHARQLRAGWNKIDKIISHQTRNYQLTAAANLLEQLDRLEHHVDVCQKLEVSETESVRNRKCQKRKVSETESVRKSQNPKVSEIKSVRKRQNQTVSEFRDGIIKFGSFNLILYQYFFFGGLQMTQTTI